jgi:hypothetical protein
MLIPTLTDLERNALKLLIKFAWGGTAGGDYEAARRLVVKALELTDDRPLDVEKRKAELNAFLHR